MFKPFKYPLPKRLRDTAQYCYVNTTIGYLEIDILSLLNLTANVIMPNQVTEITEDVLETALRAIQRLPVYLIGDILGIRYEELVGDEFDFELRRREPNDGLHETENVPIRALRSLFSRRGPGLLRSDHYREMFIALFSRNSLRGKAWTDFVKSTIRVKRGRGRPRKSEYDLIFRQRQADMQESYGKLLRRISTLDPVSPAVLLNRAKAAVAYRKRSGKASLDQGVQGRKTFAEFLP